MNTLFAVMTDNIKQNMFISTDDYMHDLTDAKVNIKTRKKASCLQTDMIQKPESRYMNNY